ncbi:response regulator [Desulfobacterales bacterium HSG2]|nr:response regulator [Desulfobacterales bacterium HSG2]
MNKDSENPEDEIPQLVNSSTPGKILIVDDEPDNIRVLAKMLTENYKLIGATSGREAIRCATCEEKVDLILLDIIMPEMDGYEVLRRLKADRRTRHIPVICVTVMGEDVNEARGFELGAVDYIRRPFSPLTVNARVKTHLALRHYHDHLEHKVDKRTTELEMANRKLREEILERKRTEDQLRLKIVREIEMEKQLRQAQKMEAIGTLASGIAHDFNNILYIILGYSEIAMENVGRDSKPFRCLEQVIRAGERGSDLVNQILSFSRGADQKVRPVRIQSVLKESMKLLRVSLPATIEIRKNIDENCGVVMADFTQIHQVIMNLCTNAYHAMRDSGGVLEINLTEDKDNEQRTTDNGQLTTDNGPQTTDHGQIYARLTVKDTGHGMDETVMANIFYPYFTTKGVGEGTGLGLSTVHDIVREYGGSVDVESKAGDGSTFTVFFPIHTKGDIPADIESPWYPLQKGNGRILLVDDEEQIVRMNEIKLKDIGYTVMAYTDSIEALEAFRSEPDNYDLVVTDLAMPKLSGHQLAAELLQIRPDVPIILCTGSDEAISEKQAKATGIREYLKKPVMDRELEKAIRRVLKSEK